MLANICPRESFRAGGMKAGTVNVEERGDEGRVHSGLSESVAIKTQHQSPSVCSSVSRLTVAPELTHGHKQPRHLLPVALNSCRCFDHSLSCQERPFDVANPTRPSTDVLV